MLGGSLRLTSAACSATVLFSKKSESERATGTFSRSRDRHGMASSECPPSAKKLLSGSTCGSERTSAQAAAISPSMEDASPADPFLPEWPTPFAAGDSCPDQAALWVPERTA